MSSSPASSERQAEYESVKQTVTAWAQVNDEIEAVAVVGSWARDEARMDSDVDVVVLTNSDYFLEHEGWIQQIFGPDARLVRTADWGAITERRVGLASGLEIEFGFGKPTWASITPVDPGTRRVISDGCEPWHDPTGLLRTLIHALRNLGPETPASLRGRAGLGDG